VSAQPILATGHPTTVAPRNFAVATNENCTGCLSFAFAYQYVVTTDGPVTITDDARRQIADLREQFAQAASSGLPPLELDARLADLGPVQERDRREPQARRLTGRRRAIHGRDHTGA
jgi:putative peptide zinc metalloprotease protein